MKLVRNSRFKRKNFNIRPTEIKIIKPKFSTQEKIEVVEENSPEKQSKLKQQMTKQFLDDPSPKTPGSKKEAPSPLPSQYTGKSSKHEHDLEVPCNQDSNARPIFKLEEQDHKNLILQAREGSDENSKNSAGFSESPELKLEKRKSALILGTPKYYMRELLDSILHPNDENYFNKLFRQHYMSTIKGLEVVRGSHENFHNQIREKEILLSRKPPYRNQKTLIFDLDETLVHCNSEVYNYQLDITLPDGTQHKAGINIRPYAQEILKELHTDYEIIIFTASHHCYADAVCDLLDPHNTYIDHRIYRDNCLQTKSGLFIKDLRVFGDRNIEDIIIVENSVYSFANQLENGVPIIPYFHNQKDDQLKKLCAYLKKLVNIDVQKANQKTFKFYQYKDYRNPVDILSKLFPRNDFRDISKKEYQR